MGRLKLTRLIRVTAVSCVLQLLPGFTTEVNATEWVVEQIGVASSSVRAAEISGYNITWKSGEGINLYNILDRTITLIPESSSAAYSVHIDGSHVVWTEEGQLWHYDGESTENMLDLGSLGEGARLVGYSAPNVLVRIGTHSDAYSYVLYSLRDRTTRTLDSLANAIAPHMGGDWMAWTEATRQQCPNGSLYDPEPQGREIFVSDGFAAFQISFNDEWEQPDSQPCEFTGWWEMYQRADGSSVVWEGGKLFDDGYHFEIFFWDGGVVQLTSNEDEDREPDVSGGNVTWMRRTKWSESEPQIYSVGFYDTSTGVEEIVATNLPGYLYPRISGKNITWVVDRRVYVALSDIQDSDSDGLWDEWELMGGIDGNHDGEIDLPLPEADPFRKNLYVEVDAMTRVAPTVESLDRVKAAFAAAPVSNPGRPDGIILHIEYDPQDAIEWAGEWGIPPGQDYWPPKFDEAKEKNFGGILERQGCVGNVPCAPLNPAHWEDIIKPLKQYVYRYCIFANKYGGSSAGGLAHGQPGAEFLVTLGGWWAPGGTIEEEAGTFMHELGHSLGIDHGGKDEVNFKPNYFSVMNYTWQTPNFLFSDSWKLDYSRDKLDTLDETLLSEQEGIGGKPGDLVPVGPGGAPDPFCTTFQGGNFRLVNQAGPVDWDCDGFNNDLDVILCWGQPCDLNHIRTDPPNPNSTTLEGHDDWANLVYLPVRSAEAMAVTEFPFEVLSESELTPEIIEELGGRGTSPMSRVLAPMTVGEQSASEVFDNTFVGIALANPNDYESKLKLRALTHDAKERTLKIDPGTVPSQGQKANLTRELVDLSSGAGFLMAEGTPPEIKGFFMVGNNDLKRLDGVGGFLRASSELYLPMIRQNETNSTYLFLFNPSLTPDQHARLRLYDGNGEFQAEKTVQFAGLGALEGTLDQIFDETIELDEGYIVITAQMPLRGFELLGGTEAFHALTAQPIYGTNRLVAPHFFAARNGGSTLRLLNIGDRDVSAAVKGYTNSGEAMGTAEITINSRKLYKGSLTELLDIDTSNLGKNENIVGYVTVEMTDGTHHLPKVIGALTFQGNGGKWVSTLPLLRRGRTRTLFLHVAQSAEVKMFTGLAILNAGAAEATVTVEVYDEDGNQSAKKEFEIAAGSRVVDLLSGPQFFGSGFQQIKGHIKVLSDLPVMSFALFGHNDQRFMSAIEGQE